MHSRAVNTSEPQLQFWWMVNGLHLRHFPSLLHHSKHFKILAIFTNTSHQAIHGNLGITILPKDISTSRAEEPRIKPPVTSSAPLEPTRFILSKMLLTEQLSYCILGSDGKYTQALTQSDTWLSNQSGQIIYNTLAWRINAPPHRKNAWAWVSTVGQNLTRRSWTCGRHLQ